MPGLASTSLQHNKIDGGHPDGVQPVRTLYGPPPLLRGHTDKQMKEEVVEKGFKERVEGSTPDEHILDGLSLRSQTRLPRGGDVSEGILGT